MTIYCVHLSFYRVLIDHDTYRDVKAQVYMASLIPIRLVDTTGKPSFLRSSGSMNNAGRDDKVEEEGGGEDMWNILSKNENLRTDLGSYIPASKRIPFGTAHPLIRTT